MAMIKNYIQKQFTSKKIEEKLGLDFELKYDESLRYNRKSKFITCTDYKKDKRTEHMFSLNEFKTKMGLEDKNITNIFVDLDLNNSDMLIVVEYVENGKTN